MLLLPLALVVLAAVLHATWNLLAKRAAEAGAAFVFAYTLVSLVAYALWVLWLLLRGTLSPSWPILACLLASGLLHLAYGLSLQRGYRVADLSVVYPVTRGTAPLLSSLGAFLFLGEVPTALGLVGLLSVLAGIGLIATGGDLSAFSRPGGQAGVRWGAATGGISGANTLVDAYAVISFGVVPVVLDWCAKLVRFVLLAPVVAADLGPAREAMRGRWPLAVGVGLLSPAGYILLLSALDMGAPLSLVAPARELSMMVGALLGMIVLREPVGPARLIGCAVLIAGVVLLGLATPNLQPG